jgi:small subunit ribosomal protein S17
MVDAAVSDRIVNRKARVGVVVSDKGDQTIIVAIERAAPHRLYHKVIRRTKRYPVHDPQNTATVGDLVRIEECRPISKTKRWRLVEVIQEREVAQVAATAIDASLVTEMQRSAARAAEEGAAPAAGTATASAGAVADSTAAASGEAETPAGDQETGAAGSDETAAEGAPEGGEQAPR